MWWVLAVTPAAGIHPSRRVMSSWVTGYNTDPVSENKTKAYSMILGRVTLSFSAGTEVSALYLYIVGKPMAAPSLLLLISFQSERCAWCFFFSSVRAPL